MRNGEMWLACMQLPIHKPHINRLEFTAFHQLGFACRLEYALQGALRNMCSKNDP